MATRRQRERKVTLIDAATGVRLEAARRGSAAGLKGTFDTPCKLNFRVGPGGEDGDKGTGRRTREAARGKREAKRLVFREYLGGRTPQQPLRYQGGEGLRPSHPHRVSCLTRCRNCGSDDFTRGCTCVRHFRHARAIRSGVPSGFRATLLNFADRRELRKLRKTTLKKSENYLDTMDTII